MKKKNAKTTDRPAIEVLIERVAPARIVLEQPRFAAVDKKPGFALEIESRGMTTIYSNSSVEELARDAMDSLTVDEETGEDDPLIPAWRRLSRMQRELVVQTLREVGARYMARATEAKIAGRNAWADFEMADAFTAAVGALHHEDLDRRDFIMPHEKLEDVPPIKITQPRAKKNGASA